MSQYFVSGSELNQVASAIRKKGQTSNNLTWPDGMISAIQAIPQQVDGISPYDMETLDAEITDLTDFPIVSEQDTYYSDINIDIDSTEKAKIISANIKNGVSILGVNGSPAVVDTSDATATASDLKYGITAYVNGQKITGTYVDAGQQKKVLNIIGQNNNNTNLNMIQIVWTEGNTPSDINIISSKFEGWWISDSYITNFSFDSTNNTYTLDFFDEGFGPNTIVIPCTYSNGILSKTYFDSNTAIDTAFFDTTYAELSTI